MNVCMDCEKMFEEGSTSHRLCAEAAHDVRFLSDEKLLQLALDHLVELEEEIATDETRAEGPKIYPREDKCRECGMHLGWVLSEAAEPVALGICLFCKKD